MMFRASSIPWSSPTFGKHFQKGTFSHRDQRAGGSLRQWLKPEFRGEVVEKVAAGVAGREAGRKPIGQMRRRFPEQIERFPKRHILTHTAPRERCFAGDVEAGDRGVEPGSVLAIDTARGSPIC